MAQRISEVIGKTPFKVNDVNGNEFEIAVTASVGVSEFTTVAQDSDGKNVVRGADRCLLILKGDRPDADGVVADRRGQIACDDRLVTEETLSAYKNFMKGLGRSSFPAPKRG